MKPPLFNNTKYLTQLTDLQSAGCPNDHPAVIEASYFHRMANSWPLGSHYFAPYSRIARSLLAKLHDLKIDARVTVPRFLWFGDTPEVIEGHRILPQSGNCFFTPTLTIVLIDLVGPNQDPAYLLDTFCHEATHATGPVLGRWTRDQQPQDRDSEAYYVEEAVAFLGAQMITGRFGATSPYETVAASKAFSNYVGHPGRRFNWLSDAEQSALNAVNCLLSSPSRRSLLKQYVIDFFSLLRR